MTKEALPPDLRQLNAQLDTYVENPGHVQPVNELLLAKLREQQSSPSTVIETFLPDWNRACRSEGGGKGLALGWYILIAGPTGAGKTLAALNLVVSALRQGVNVLYFSLEMTWKELVTRLRPITTGDDVTCVEWGNRYSTESAEAADQELLALPGRLHLNTEPIWALRDIRRSMEAHYRVDGVRLFVVDYAQLVEPSGSDRRLFEMMTTISSELRHTGKKIGATTVVVSQLNRDSTRDRTGPPTVDGLFGSARFGFDADQVLILDTRRRERVPERRVERIECVLVKNRHGPQVTIPVELSTATLRFRQIMPDEDGWP